MDKRYPAGIMGTVVIPWTADYTLDEERFIALTSALASETHHLYVFGTAGEGYEVTDTEFQRIVVLFRDTLRRVDPSIEPMVGLVSTSTGTIRHRIDWCLQHGVSSFQIALPGWEPLSSSEVRAFFDQTCGAFRTARFMHYNTGRSGARLTAADYRELADRHPNLVAGKQPGVSVVDAMELQTDESGIQHFFTEPLFPQAALHGECGLLVSVASISWPVARELFRTATEGSAEAAAAIYREVMAVRARVLSLVLPHGHVDGAFDKLFAKFLLEDFPLRLKPPYTAPDDKVYRALRDYLGAEHPRWLAPGD